ncbi:hypothetical protein OU789_02630 [Halocynthiibacter sp. C4]|uniref:hypothetical protein n=1 Tax=Halocynthiibacter sp. C4 TaxID=2992758 RepID=UPI00237B9883|nr:hypothetical protein [Halocynthiibacter sp. C4]MDE0588818.1 hypothetical protein [Halocynthiibacter sp. C4]
MAQTLSPIFIPKDRSQAPIVMTQGSTSRIVKKLRNDLAKRAQGFEKNSSDENMLPESALVVSVRDFRFCEELLENSKLQLLAVETALRALKGEPEDVAKTNDIQNPMYQLVTSAHVLFRASEIVKLIDPNMALCDLSDTTDGLEEVLKSLETDVSTASNNLEHCERELSRLATACIATKGCVVGFLGKEIFNFDERNMFKLLPDEIYKRLTDEIGLQITNKFEYGIVTNDAYEPEEKNLRANYLSAACQFHQEEIKRVKAAQRSKALRAKRRLKDRQIERKSEATKAQFIRSAAGGV